MANVRTVGVSGQISLGKAYAGRAVLIDETQPGTWIIKLGQFVPDSEKWILEPGVEQEIDQAIRWASEHSPQETKLKALARKMGIKDV